MCLNQREPTSCFQVTYVHLGCDALLHAGAAVCTALNWFPISSHCLKIISIIKYKFNIIILCIKSYCHWSRFWSIIVFITFESSQWLRNCCVGVTCFLYQFIYGFQSINQSIRDLYNGAIIRRARRRVRGIY